MTTQDLLRKTNSVYNAQYKHMDATKEEVAEYMATPVAIHHQSEDFGYAFSYEYRGTTYRYQYNEGELYGPFDQNEWEEIKADYVSAGCEWN